MLTKIALAAALIAGTATVALAEGDSTIGIYGPTGGAAFQSSAPTFTSRNVALGGGQRYQAPAYVAPRSGDWFSSDVNDRASSPFTSGN